MGIAILIVFAILFIVFMFSIGDIDESAKTVSLVLSIILIGYILFRVIRGIGL